MFFCITLSLTFRTLLSILISVLLLATIDLKIFLSLNVSLLPKSSNLYSSQRNKFASVYSHCKTLDLSFTAPFVVFKFMVELQLISLQALAQCFIDLVHCASSLIGYMSKSKLLTLSVLSSNRFWMKTVNFSNFVEYKRLSIFL